MTSSVDSFRADICACQCTQLFTFSKFHFVLTKRGQPGELDNLMEPDNLVIEHQRSSDSETCTQKLRMT